jgi:ribosomal protein L7/L12
MKYTIESDGITSSLTITGISPELALAIISNTFANTSKNKANFLMTLGSAEKRILETALGGSKLQAVKDYKELYNVGLKEAKDYVFKLVEDYELLPL